MIRETRFSKVLYARLNATLGESGCAALPDFLRSLSVSQFRTAGYVLGDHIAIEVEPRQFWELFFTLVQMDNRAFLVTMLRALVRRLESGDVTLDDDGFKRLAAIFTETDSIKTLQRLLPLQTDHRAVSALLGRVKIDDAMKRIRLLLPVGTIPCAYVLFRTLRYVEHDHALLVRVAMSLVRQGNPVSFNMASLMRVYFGLSELKGTFSLRLNPWQLSRLETSYEAFAQVMLF